MTESAEEDKRLQDVLSALCHKENLQTVPASKIKNMTQIASNKQLIANYMGITTTKKKCVLLRTTGAVKLREVVMGQEKSFASKMTGTQTPTEISCSRLCVGKLSDAIITVWYDDERAGKNKRLQKILGIPVAGDALFCKKEGDFTIEEFLECEKKLKSMFELK